MAENTANSTQPEQPRSSSQGGKGKEQRAALRYRVNFKVYIRRGVGDVTYGQAHNLSMKGIYLDYDEPARSGKILHMAFDLPIRSEFRRIFARARVMRAVFSGKKEAYELALNFTEFAKDTEKYLSEYCRLREL